MNMQLEQILQKATANIKETKDLLSLNDIRIKYIGKKGIVTNLIKKISSYSEVYRPKAGKKINELKQKLHISIEQQRIKIESESITKKNKRNHIDIALPGRGLELGSMHPITKIRIRIDALFKGLGFHIVEGPEIEDDFHNFTALNMPKYHPARAMQDTFYFEDERYVLRTHTSPVQIRYMQLNEPPIRVLASGKVYRCDSDATHTPMFHQVEGLMVDKNISFANLKDILNKFLSLLFEKTVIIRFRGSYFPFTEPSAEVDMQCTRCCGKGCRLCCDTGWLEILGCGMVQPVVLENCNINSENYTGWAFGAGIDRLAMLRYNIPDLRMMFENDLRFITQF